MGGRSWITASAAPMLLLIGAAEEHPRPVALPPVDAGMPTTRFDPAQAPPPPDYAGPANWVSLPWIRDDGDTVPKGVAEPPQLRAPADIFFIHPSVPMRQPAWNADPRDVWFNGDVGQTTIRNQASAFNGCCALYAPRYRQVTPGAVGRDGPDAAAAFALAYDDISRAFRAFRARVGDRPFIIAGHGAGSRLGRMLIAREIAGTPVAGRMVAAYLIGDPVARGERTPVRLCSGASDTGCIVSWSMVAEGARGAQGRIACINPVSWTNGREASPRAAHLGAWMRGGMEFPEPLRAPDAGRVTMRCGRDGRLIVSDPGDPYRAAIGPDGDAAALDYALVWMDVRANATARVAAFLARGG